MKHCDRGDLDREKEVIDTITSVDGKYNALSCIGIYLTKNGYEDKGSEYILEALQIAKEDDRSDLENRSRSIGCILKQYLRQTNKCDRLPQLLKTIEDGLTRAKVFVELSIELKIDDPAIINELFLEIAPIQDSNPQETGLALVKIANL
ncbi:hypothetical protein [Anaplasma marginale]|uniref:hypothetical protein n=1 Tax=Anaplasma marginale TaxID=770 RepID=UPI0005B4FB72|nr:hypothetical protein [Anaplasma marginale]